MRRIYFASTRILLSFLFSALPFQVSIGKQTTRDFSVPKVKIGSPEGLEADQKPAELSADGDPAIDAVMPAPLPKLDQTLPFARKLFLSEQDIVKRPKQEIGKLAELHLERFKRIRTVQGSAWNSFVRTGSERGSTILVDFWYQSSPAKSKVLTKYLPFELRGQRPGPGVFQTKFAEINTPDMHVFSDGEFGEKVATGLSTVSVKPPGSQTVARPFNFDTLFLPSFFVTDTKQYFSDLDLGFQEGRFNTEVRTRGELMEFRLWSTRSSKDSAFRWICDLSKSGNVVYFDSVSTIGEIKYRESEGIWLPCRFHERKFEQASNTWKEEMVIRYFNLSVNEGLNEDLFTVQSLPVRDLNVPVTDRRAAPYPRVPFWEFIEN